MIKKPPALLTTLSPALCCCPTAAYGRPIRRHLIHTSITDDETDVYRYFITHRTLWLAALPLLALLADAAALRCRTCRDDPWAVLGGPVPHVRTKPMTGPSELVWCRRGSVAQGPIRVSAGSRSSRLRAPEKRTAADAPGDGRLEGTEGAEGSQRWLGHEEREREAGGKGRRGLGGGARAACQPSHAPCEPLAQHLVQKTHEKDQLGRGERLGRLVSAGG